MWRAIYLAAIILLAAMTIDAAPRDPLTGY